MIAPPRNTARARPLPIMSNLKHPGKLLRSSAAAPQLHRLTAARKGSTVTPTETPTKTPTNTPTETTTYAPTYARTLTPTRPPTLASIMPIMPPPGALTS
jgi:hypothetical protein